MYGSVCVALSCLSFTPAMVSVYVVREMDTVEHVCRPRGRCLVFVALRPSGECMTSIRVEAFLRV